MAGPQNQHINFSREECSFFNHIKMFRLKTKTFDYRLNFYVWKKPGNLKKIDLIVFQWSW